MKRQNSKKDKYQTSNDSFICINCGREVSLNAPGTKNRNHCPYCLHSLHVDNKIGDRSSKCLGNMYPVAKFYKPNGEEVIVHKCAKCNFIRYNRIAGDDDFEKVENLKTITIEEIENL